MTEYNAKADGEGSYLAAIEAKRLRGDDYYPERPLEKRLNGDIRYRDISAEDANTCGRAGEHLVCADILARGVECFIAEGRLPYDVVADFGRRMVRIQVKTTSGAKRCPQRANDTPVYMWNARRFGKGGRQCYESKDADLVAYVALDRGLIAYKSTERIAQSTVLRIRDYEEYYYTKTGQFIDEFPLEKAIKELGLCVRESSRSPEPVQEGLPL